MAIRFNCDNAKCGKIITAPGNSAGKKARCPHCGRIQPIPKPPEKDIYDLAEDSEAPLDERPAAKAPAPSEVAVPANTDKPAQPSGRTNTCVVCSTIYPVSQRCPRCHPQVKGESRWSGIDKQRYMLIGVIVLVFALLGAGAVWVIKNMAQVGSEHVEADLGALKKAEDSKCMMDMDAVSRSIQVEAMANNGKLPQSLSSLYSSSQLRCSIGSHEAWTYIAGQNTNMPPTNVVLYETAGAHNGRCCVLRLGGSVDMLTPEEVKAEVSKTQRIVAARKK
ncbi:MAG: hypothetical protein WC869_15865 [Phycisphaerae bacterium]|jgi:hypothetical protein